MLSEQRRTQLDGIVQQMIQNKEPDSNIQFVVDDFKSKYENEQQNVQKVPEQKSGLLERAAGTVDKTLGKASDFMFGTFGRTAGSLITGATGRVAKLYGQATGNEKAYNYGKQLASSADKNITPTNIAFTSLELYPGGGYVSKALKKIPGGTQIAEVLSKVPGKLRGKAIKQYAEALGATKEEFKKLTQKVVPELLDRGVKAKNLESLASRASVETETAGKAIGDVVEALPDAVQSKTKPIIDTLSKLKGKYIVEGKVVNPTAINAIDGVTKTIEQFGEEVSTKSLLQVRRILDESVAAGKGFVKDKITNMGDQAEKAAADAIREIISQDVPNLSKLNAEFSFWNNVKKISKETLKRKSTQGKGLSQVITSVAGGTSGFASGDNIGERLKNATIGVVIGKYAGTFNSAGYKMLSANTKNKLAKIIASGNVKQINLALSKIAAALKNLSE